MKKEDIDYSFYLVTDSTPAILGQRDLDHVVESALRGGVTCVQYRDKTADTGKLISVAGSLLERTRRAGVPLLINDRVDVALAVGCEGVHIGQDDMDLATARQLLGPDAVIGVTVSSIEEALAAAAGGADYLGIGTVYATPTKKDTKSIIGTQGVRKILESLASAGFRDLQTVCIGGIKVENVDKVLKESASSAKQLNGVAVVSAVMAAEAPDAEAANLALKVRHVRTGGSLDHKPSSSAVAQRAEPMLPPGLLDAVPVIFQAIREKTPLSHNMTNLVVQNFAANVALAVGASPIMANYGEEAEDLSRLGGALVINMGTVTPEGLENYTKALRAYNRASRPVLFDPVGAGATSVRRAAVKTIMGSGHIDLVKGNEGEIRTIYGQGELAQQRGVDSSSTLSPREKAELVKALAARESCLVLLTGKEDYISDGSRTFSIANGHELLGRVTGTGCVLGTTLSAYLSAAPAGGDVLHAILVGMLHFEIAAERAAERRDVKGPGTYVPAFIDELAAVRDETGRGELGWLQRAKVTEL